MRIIMPRVKVTELRQNLPAYLVQVGHGEEIEITVHGRVVARIVPEQDRAEAARVRLAQRRKDGARILGDIVNMPKVIWDGER
jgi:prevent-host-death family protein